MFIGHIAVGFASKRAAPNTSLGLLVTAALCSDLLFPIFALAGWERVRIAPGDTAFMSVAFDSYPISHSLLTTVGWAALIAFLYWIAARHLRGAAVLFLAGVSHWFLDALTHRPDMPWYPGGPVAGLGLWNSIPGTVLVECAMFAIGVWLYVRTTAPRDRTGRYALWALLLFLLVIYARAATGNAPPSARAWQIVGLSGWLLPLWAWWIDRHRSLRGGD